MKKMHGDASCIPISHGIVEGIGACTAGNCNIAGINSSSSGISTVKVYFSWLLVGQHLEDIDDEYFSGSSVELVGLSNWIRHIDNVAHTRRDSDCCIGESKIATFDISNTKHFSFCSVSSKYSFEANTQFSLRHGSSSLTAKGIHSLTVRSHCRKSLKDTLADIHPLRHVLSMMAIKLLPFKKIRLLYHGPSNDCEHHCVLLICDRADQRPPHPIPFLSLNEISDYLPEIISNWYHNPMLYQLQSNLLHTRDSTPGEMSDYSFLGLCSAIESFHRNHYNGTYVSTEDHGRTYEALKNAIPSDLHKDYKEKIKSSLKYANEHSLRKRLKSILLLLGDRITAQICENKKVFVNKIVDTRNGLTHRLPTDVQAEKEGVSLYWSCFQLEWILRCSILIELGVPRSLIEEKLKSVQSLKSAMTKGV